MRAMKAYLHELCQCQHGGGRVVEMQAGKMVSVLDIEMWDEDQSQCIQSRFPGTAILLTSCKASRSGFRVDCILPEGKASWTSKGCLSFFGLLAVYAALSILVLPVEARPVFVKPVSFFGL